MKEKQNIVLGSFDEPFELFSAYTVLLRALTEAKFSEESFDDVLQESTILADLSNEVVKKLDELGENLKFSGPGVRRRWLTVVSRDDRWYIVMLRKKLAQLTRDETLKNYLESLTLREKMEYLEVMFAPCRITQDAAKLFLSDLGVTE